VAKYKVEVEGHYCAVIEVEAGDAETAESLAITNFEHEYLVVGNNAAESWDHTDIVSSEELDEDC